ncbi:MAG TPA: signal protein, partial [Actinoplanes sp.]
MSAMSVHRHGQVGVPSGAAASSLLIPIGVAVLLSVLGLIYAVMAAPTEDDRAGAAYLAARLETSAQIPAQRQPSRPAPTLGGGAWTYRDRSKSSPNL